MRTMYFDNRTWKAIGEDKDRDHIFIYTLKHPDKNDLTKWKLAVSEYLYNFKETRSKRQRTIVLKPLCSNDETLIFEWKKPQGLVSHNSVWYYGKTMHDHYDDAIEAFRRDKKRLLEDAEKRYIAALNNLNTMSYYFDNLQNK